MSDLTKALQSKCDCRKCKHVHNKMLNDLFYVFTLTTKTLKTRVKPMQQLFQVFDKTVVKTCEHVFDYGCLINAVN